MTKQAISVTLHRDNITWLKGRADAAGYRSVSELLDRLVTNARMAGQVVPARSVVGTIEINASDTFLEGADAVVRELFETSLGRPLLTGKAATRRSAKPAKRRRRG